MAAPVEHERVPVDSGTRTWRQVVRATVSIPHADALARRAAALLQRIAIPVARAAAAFATGAGWTEWAYARQQDFAREVLFRSARWLRQAAALGRALERWPALAAAVSGADGLSPIGQVAALEIAALKDESEIDRWIAYARTVPLRTLRDALAAKRAEGGLPPESVASEDDEVRLRIELAPAHLDAFEAGLERHRQYEGHEATVTSFIEALHAEIAAGPVGPASEDELRAVHVGPARAELERRALARGSLGYGSFDASSDEQRLLGEITTELAEAEALFARAGKGEGYELGWQLVHLLMLGRTLRRMIGVLLALLGKARGWQALGYADAGHYGEERLGISRSTAAELLAAARASMAIPEFADEYDSARIHTIKAVLIARLLRQTGSAGPIATAWADHADGITVKRLRDEVQIILSRARRGAFQDRDPLPLSDEEWRREREALAGATAREIAAAAREGLVQEPTATLHLRLDHDLALRFTAALDRLGRRLLALESAKDPARTFSLDEVRRVRGFSLAYAVACYTSTKVSPTSRGRRCDAPGCTARACHAHHVRYRSHGGDDTRENLVMLCPFHHLQGEHGLLMRVRGVAPDGLTYRMGRSDRASWFRNERRLSVPGDTGRGEGAEGAP